MSDIQTIILQYARDGLGHETWAYTLVLTDSTTRMKQYTWETTASMVCVYVYDTTNKQTLWSDVCIVFKVQS